MTSRRRNSNNEQLPQQLATECDEEEEDRDNNEEGEQRRQTTAVKQIMVQCVAPQSSEKYSGQNAGFVMYCFDSVELRDKLLEPWFIEGITAIERQFEQKRYAKECCQISSPEDDNCPLILSNLTFAIFSDYLSTRTRCKGKNRGEVMALSNSSYEQSQSALKHLYQMKQLKQFTQGIRRTVADKKKEQGDSMMIGKKKMDFKVYQKMCELFLEEEGEEFIFACCFLTLEWNLMARSENVVHAHMFHVTWDNDSLVFRFVKSKGDQTGRNRDQAWHVYANLNNPAVCPVLTMGCYIFANPGIFGVDDSDSTNLDGSDHNGRLFPGSYQYERFMDCMHRIIAKHHDDFFALGISAGDLGSHSARKGSASYACAGSTVSPPMVSVCLRAMWSMGHIKERYLQYEKAGDQYLGRVVCGLDVNDASFAVSPPFFDADHATIEKIHLLLVTADMHRVFYYCYASLTYHRDFLAGILHRSNKLQASPFYNTIPNFVKDAAAVKFPWTKTEATPVFTGLPPHVVILATCEELKLELRRAKEEIVSGVKEDLDNRQIGSQSYFDKEEIIEKMTAFHDEVLKRMDRVGHSGYAALRRESGADDDAIQVSGGANEDTSVVTHTPITMVERDERRFQFFYNAGTVSRLPEGFVFPKMTLATLLTSWFCGNQSTRTIPFKLLKAPEFENKREKLQLCKMRKLIGAVIVGAKQLGVWRDRRGAWDIGLTVRLFENVKHVFEYPTKNGRIRRTVQISWLTVYNLYVKNGRTFATEVGVTAESGSTEDDTVESDEMELAA
ncbi:hypothetical protein ACHAWU_006437 [Discostella pseudostelligera]|uniref:Uncharacterized protein n=1 Tax=Discostella pseudostelligera TaxID=259834 RepID=A0ABD3NE53_9STRA